MLGIYLQQTISTDDIFRCIFLGALRVKYQIIGNIFGYIGFKEYGIFIEEFDVLA